MRGTVSITEIVEAIQKGIDVNSNFKVLFDRYYRNIVIYFIRKGFNIEDSRDLTQETFLKVFRAISNLESPEKFKSWISAIANNTYRNEIRRRASLKESISKEIELHENIEDYSDNLEPDMIEYSQRIELERALSTLPPQTRRCIILKANGFKYNEIAKLLCISIGTVKSHIFLGRNRLRELLKIEE